jgi:hypothetical protein
MGDTDAPLARRFRGPDGREHLAEVVQFCPQDRRVSFGLRLRVHPPSGAEWCHERRISLVAFQEECLRPETPLIGGDSHLILLGGICETGFRDIGEAIGAGRRLGTDLTILSGSPEFPDLIGTIRAAIGSPEFAELMEAIRPMVGP